MSLASPFVIVHAHARVVHPSFILHISVLFWVWQHNYIPRNTLWTLPTFLALLMHSCASFNLIFLRINMPPSFSWVLLWLTPKSSMMGPSPVTYVSVLSTHHNPSLKNSLGRNLKLLTILHPLAFSYCLKNMGHTLHPLQAPCYPWSFTLLFPMPCFP